MFGKKSSPANHVNMEKKKKEKNEEGGRERERKEEEEEEEEEDVTCCHRMTICNPVIREIVVTKPVSKYLGQYLTWAKLFQLATSVGITLIGWGVLYFLLGDVMLPQGNGFGLYALVMFSYTLGWSLTYVPYLHLPAVFGMLLAGIIVRNTGLYDIHEDLGISTTSKIRTFCLTFIMIRAGLQLSTTSLKRHPIFLLTLAIVPTSVEMLILSICCKYILQYPWDWSFMTGAIIACMSPVVTINCVLALAEQGYGEDKGLPTVLCTAACIDDVHIVSLFAVCYSIVFANDENRTEWWSYVPAGCRDFIVGVSTGIVLGVCLVFFPHRSYKYVTLYRMIGLVLASLMCTSATARLTISGGGYLACAVLSFIAVTGWKILSTMPFRQAAFFLWHLVQPILVGVIGADIDFTGWSSKRFGLHVLCICIGLTARCIVTYLTTHHSAFTWKERLFVVICWLPKGTLQAALGPMAFEHLQGGADLHKTELAIDVMRLSVIAILALAPLGASLIATSGPILLHKITDEERQRDRELSYLRILSLQLGRTTDTETKHKRKSIETV